MDLKTYIQEKNRPLYMPYLTIGDPDFESTEKFALAMIDAGADIMELGIPFSDPTADGPVIQAAMSRALSQPDFSLEKVFSVARRIHEQRPGIPLVFLTYINPVLTGFLTPGAKDYRETYDAAANIERFQKECLAAGVSGAVIPDLPYDQPEGEIFLEEAERNNFSQIMMIAPNTSARRFKKICSISRGFIYYVTSLGVTGERKELPPELKSNIKRIKKTSGLPVISGFGFSEPEQIQSIKGIVDGIIVGSLNHRIIQDRGRDSQDELVRVTRGFVDALGA